MELVKLCLSFFIIIVVLGFKKPLYFAMAGGLIAAIILFKIPLLDSAIVLGKSAISGTTMTVILSFYSINILQRMLEKRSRIKSAQEALNGIFNNRRINTALAPCVFGLLPSAGVLTIAARIVDDSCKDYLSPEDRTFVSSFFRHIPESFLPTYSSIILMLAFSGVQAGSFVVAMLPMVIALFALGHVFYLRKMPKDTGVEPSKNKTKDVVKFFKNLWSLTAAIIIIMAFNISVPVAVFIIIAVNFFIDKFKIKEFLPMLLSAVEVKMFLNTFLVMMFKDIVTYTGVINLLPDFFTQLDIPVYLVFALIFFFGTIVSGATGMVALAMPIVMVTVPSAGLPLVVLLMCFTYAAMQVSPTHICLTVATNYFNTTLDSLIKRTIPVILLFCIIALVYYYVLVFLGA